MNDEILQSIKKLLGIDPSYTVFDQDLRIHINSVFMILNQLGVGPAIPFTLIPDAKQTWSDFTASDATYSAVITYVYMRVRLVFDPPESSFALAALERQIQEYEWRLNVKAETP